jgi:hypothetical protein
MFNQPVGTSLGKTNQRISDDCILL